MLKKISFALLLGVFGTIFFAQYDPWTHKKIVLLIQKIAKESLEGDVVCLIQSVNFFAPSLVLHDVEMKSVDSDGWFWRCKKCEISCSWMQLLCKGTMDQHVEIDGFECSSRIENSYLVIEPHIMALMQKSFLPFSTELKSIVFKNAHFYGNDEQLQSNISLVFNSSSLRIGKQIKTTMSIGDGEVAYAKSKYIESIAADLSITTEYVGDQLDIGAQIAGTFVLPHMAVTSDLSSVALAKEEALCERGGSQGVVRHSFSDGGGCYVTGGWKSGRGRFAVRNAHNSLIIDPIIITERELRVNARFPLSYIAQCITNSVAKQMINGMGNFSIKISRDESRKIEGQLVVEDVAINHHHLCDVGKIIFTRQGDDWKTRLAIYRCNQESVGTGHWHESTKKGDLVVNNVTDITAKALPYWRLKPNFLNIQVVVDNNNLTGTYDAVATHTLSDAMHSSSGTISFTAKEQGLFGAQGLIDENKYDISAILYPHFALHNCVYKDKDNKQLIALQATDDKQISGSVSFPFIRSLINNTIKYDVQGEGNLDVVAEIFLPHVVADFTLNDATIRLPQTYNFIDGFHAHCIYNVDSRSAVLENVNLSLHTGKMNCLRATAYFEHNGSLVFAHAPLILDRCLLNVKKDLFAIVSGNLLFSKSLSSAARVDGHIIIDKAQLKENLFSGIIQKQLLSYTHSVFSLPDVPLQCDLVIETKAPIIVDTGFLQTNAHVNVRVQKDGHEPTVTGSLVLQAGTLNFPYKPLYISKGVITFSPEQLFDPTIELVARNKIKKYDVALQVEGSLSTHQITLDATPPLSEEQIVGLLLVGAEENSLNSMMPALIVQNLKSLIFSNNQSSFFDKYFKPLLGSFNINLVPSFTDQTGRGGLRGALEISLDDRWRAVIQKNFSLTEDTKFELEFLVSDDITLRAIRDERRDVGGEVEMRWKF